jgi:hypothetical protein
MKHDSDPALLRASYLSNEIIKRTLNFLETLSLMSYNMSYSIIPFYSISGSNYVRSVWRDLFKIQSDYIERELLGRNFVAD